MTREQRIVFANDLQTRKLKARAAVALLISEGMDPWLAEEDVFQILGGSDIVQEGKDGKDYYIDSGKSVEEVNRLMAE